MAEEDEKKITFLTSQGVYYYTKMPFGLKNTRATYQRLVDKAFKKQIGMNLEVYVDDLVIKSHTEQKILIDVEETFQVPRKINMKLNPKKCTFEAEEETAKAKRRYDNVSLCNQRGNQCSLVRGKRLDVDADLFCQPCITSFGNQLQLNGKSSTGSGTCLKKAKKILPGAHSSGHHRSTNQANLVVT
ncbi:reverse transcriptase domain-containing protein [Tanacetum coccineum]